MAGLGDGSDVRDVKERDPKCSGLIRGGDALKRSKGSICGMLLFEMLMGMFK